MSASGNDSTKIRKVIIREYNFKQLAWIYDISKYLLRKKIKPHKQRIGPPALGYEYDTNQVALLFELVPVPSDVLIIIANRK
jgi:hypothetical protein